MPRLNAPPQPSTSKALLAATLPKKRGRPSLSDLILRAVCVSTARKGASLAVIKKALAAEGYDVRRNSGRLKAALGALLNKGLLQRVTGSGVAGSFRVGRVGKARAAATTRRRGRTRGGGGRRPAGKARGPRRAVQAPRQRPKKATRRRAKAAGGDQAAAGGEC
ncbi:histone H1.4-like [Struthio camelus]|uniref:histone H1.4-like n=1 Tax=Struthio camelus TaxID=8801 RepID=UPI003603F9CE